METMTTWFTADLHLGHCNIIDYCGHPFEDAEAMNRALIEGSYGAGTDLSEVGASEADG